MLCVNQLLFFKVHCPWIMILLLLFVLISWPSHSLTTNATSFPDSQLSNIWHNKYDCPVKLAEPCSEIMLFCYGDEREHKCRYFRNTSESFSWHVLKSQITKIVFLVPVLELHFPSITHVCEQQVDITHLMFRQQWEEHERLPWNFHHKINSLSLEQGQGWSVGGRFMPS